MSRFMLADSDQSPLAAAVRQAIGAGPSESVEVMTPEFNRPAAWEPAMAAPTPIDVRAWSGFTSADRETLKSWGCRPWSLFTTERPADKHTISKAGSWYFDADETGTPATHELWLFPAEWYDQIPNGFPITDIFGCIESFERGKTDDDRRFGLLAFGVMIPIPSLYPRRTSDE